MPTVRKASSRGKAKPKAKEATRPKKPAAPKAGARGRQKQTPSQELGLVAGRLVVNSVPTYGRDYRQLGKGFPVPAWRLEERLGGGAEGDVWLAEAMADEDGRKPKSPALHVALKVASDESRLFYEVHNMSRLGCQTLAAQDAGLPLVYGHGIDKTPGQPPMKFLALELLGDDLNTVYVRERGFESETIRLIGANLVRALRYVHSKGYIYRDISMGNVMLGAAGSANSDRIFLIDVGVAEKINDMGNKAFSGTPAFASANALRPKTSTGPADDLVALGHILAYCDLGGTLPWMGGGGGANQALTQAVLNAAADKRERAYKDMYKGLLCRELQEFFEYVLPLSSEENFTTELEGSVYDHILDIFLDGLPAAAKYQWAATQTNSRANRTPIKKSAKAKAAARSPGRSAARPSPKAKAAARSPGRSTARPSPKATRSKARSSRGKDEAVDVTNIGRLTVPVLRQLLAESGLDTGGLKAALVARLSDHLSGESAESPPRRRRTSTATAAPAASPRSKRGAASGDVDMVESSPRTSRKRAVNSGSEFDSAPNPRASKRARKEDAETSGSESESQSESSDGEEDQGWNCAVQ